MPPQEQADLWMALRDRMKVDWNEMTLQEKKAGTSAYPIELCCGGWRGRWVWLSAWVRRRCRGRAGFSRDQHK